MKIKELIQGVKPIAIIGNIEDEIREITTNSRSVEKGDMFIAVRGTVVDGHKYIDSAIESGATCIVCEEEVTNPNPSITYIQLKSTQQSLGHIASNRYHNPSSRIILVGVTGTNGKTTIATLLYTMLKRFGERVGLLSTVCNYIDDVKIEATHTTPDAISINRLLNNMIEAGCRYAFMEVSSHAAEQDRIAGLNFNGGVFTNLTRDHLDYHKTTDAYIKAKKKFFDNLPKDAFAITNIDDKVGEVMLQNCKAKKITYSLNRLADFKGRIMESRMDGTTMQINGREVETLFVGDYNAYNLLAVYAAAISLGEDNEETLRILSTLTAVTGRFETVTSQNGVVAVIDYAHTPDALKNVLTTIKAVTQDRNEIIAVIGAGGNRDKGKRPLMAQEGAKVANRLILTSDNPRDEEPNQIIADMKEGLTASQLKNTLTIPDRKEAINLAIQLANSGDVILIAGKGHEDYQEIKGVKHHFSDKETVEEIFNQQKN